MKTNQMRKLLKKWLFGKEEKQFLATIEVWQHTSQYWHDSFKLLAVQPNKRPFARFVTDNGLEFFEPLETYTHLHIGHKIEITRNYLGDTPKHYQINDRMGGYSHGVLTYYITEYKTA